MSLFKKVHIFGTNVPVKGLIGTLKVQKCAFGQVTAPVTAFVTFMSIFI